METYYKVSIEIEEVEIDDQQRVSYRAINLLFPLTARFETEKEAIEFVMNLDGWAT